MEKRNWFITKLNQILDKHIWSDGFQDFGSSRDEGYWSLRYEKQITWTLGCSTLLPYKSFQVTSTEGKPRWSTSNSSSWEKQSSWSSQDGVPDKELQRESAADSYRVSALSIQLNTDQCLRVRKYLRPEKESPKRIRGTSARWTLRVKSHACIHQAGWKPRFAGHGV